MLTSGVLALLWLLLRSGSKPSRLAYPCQQAAVGTAAAAFGAPVVAALLVLRNRIMNVLWTMYASGGSARAKARGSLVRSSRRAEAHGSVVRSSARAKARGSLAGKTAAGALGALAMVMLAIASVEPKDNVTILTPPDDYHPDVYLVNKARGIEPGRYGGVDDLITLMGVSGLKWHRAGETGLTTGPDGLIDPDDVVLIKINAQWPQRGGTNTDVLRGVIRRIVEHPDGFIGEIVVADNGQGSGSFDRSDHNAEVHDQSTQDVVNDFAAEGWNISTYRWDNIRYTLVNEYSTRDMTDGYVVNPVSDPETQIKVSYPKFRSALGTYISYKHGVLSPATGTYESDKLVVINIPVFKTHSIYAVTASVKNHMGVVTKELRTDSHNAVRRGGMGSVLAEVRMPDLTILDCIWILARPGSGPSASYDNATRRDQLLASTDPIALDMWATKFIMIPQIIENGYAYDAYHTTQDPDNPDSVFRRYLDRSMNELLLAGIATTNNVDAVDLHVWVGDLDRDGDVDKDDFSETALCLAGPADDVAGTDCEDVDFDEDGDADLADIAAFQRTFTGALLNR
ncbi:MAG: DUF362 domain-containing protein [Phycisphaerae bacterium]